MRLSTLTIVPVVALLLMSSATGGVIATTVPFHAQQSPNGTPGTEVTGTTTTTTPSATPAASGQGDGPTVTFDDQEGSGQSVHIQSVTLPEPGFVAIYDSSRSSNEANQIIGTFYLVGSGTFTDFTVPLDSPINESTSLTAVVHTDSNNNGQFDYVSSNGSQDAPLTPQGDRRIVDIAQVTVQNGGGSSNTAKADSSADEGASTTTGNPSNGDTNGTNGNASTDSSGSSGFGPGFGFVVGVVALLAIALVAVARK